MPPFSPLQVRVLLATAALSSSVGLVLELMLVTQASYLLGDVALATGMVIGTFLAAMGLGAWLSQFVGGGERSQQRLLSAFLLVELCLSPLCLLGPLALFALFSVDGPLWLALVVVTVLVGVLGGMEVPLLTRLLESQQHLRKALARVLALDYLGALLGSLLFPLLLLPRFGLLPTAGLLAMMPLISSAVLCWVFPGCRRWRWPVSGALPLAALAAWALVPLGNRIEDGLYDDPVVGRVQSRHQRIVLTSRRGDLRLFLDGNLQFSSLDEYRYHEALVHPALALHGRPERVLLLGAGDGLAAREILRWPGVRRLDLVELDPQMLQLARAHPFLRRLNQASLDDPRVQTHIGDAFELVRRLPGPYDVVIADFPDPDSPALARLYSVTFYGRLLGRLAPAGLLVTQASTPFFTPKVMASIQATLAELDLVTRPYSVDVPSFGPWGFVLAHRPGRPLQVATPPFEGRWFDRAQLETLFALPRDLRPPGDAVVLPNRLTRPVLDGYQRQSLWRQD
ncbi:polyamine aminopropyltransferase [Synechococcus sp. EJ6-Ellesmere]|uniref:polyamine aminopropyltransferase n=1 Tax=Synechococcus sp. EJ6-Ellesmere TaxID=2823734 RepID=UPI0020CFE67A|nr:polyamine aminopropyltransferase [Synechococcus sp. EJ6-Ellesmere]MCP9826362.1 polyamine aminopropyltransferase [Synechococcus sp. EJ6-Ellesmere]